MDFKLSTAPQFIDKVRHVVGLYLNPPDAAVVSCVDEDTKTHAARRIALDPETLRPCSDAANAPKHWRVNAVGA